MNKKKNKRVNKNFDYREGKKILQCIEFKYSAAMFGAYVGIRDNREIQIIRNHCEQIKWVLHNWKTIPDGFRVLCLNDAIWEGTDFSKRNILDKFTGKEERVYDSFLVMSGVNGKNKLFAYDIKDKKTMQSMLKIAKQKNNEIGPVVFLVYGDENGKKQEFEIRNLKSINTAIKLADEKGKKLKVKTNE